MIARKSATAVVAGLSFLISTPAFAGMSCEDIMNLVDHSVPTAVVVDTIESSGTTFSDSDIQCLKQRGAPADVLAKALEFKRASAPAPTQQEAAPAPTRSSSYDQAEELGSGDVLSDSDDDDDAGGSAELESLIRDFKAQKYRTASYGLFELLRENSYPDKDSTIKYYLAKSLQELGMFHAAQYYYMEVVRKGPRNPLFKHALPRLAEVAERTGNDYELLRIVGKIAPESYPRQARPHLYYLMGRKSYDAGELSDAASYFEKVPQDSELYPRAQYFTGLIGYERQRYKSAAKSFREVIRAPVATDDKRLQGELEDLKDLSLINVARIYYSLERFDNADKYYAKVDHKSTYWPQSLFERAWTQFWLGDLNGELGQLVTAGSPFFAGREFLPDTGYLKALTYFQLCEYDEVDRTVKNFQSTYQPVRDEMKRFIEKVRADGSDEAFAGAFDAYFGENANPDSKIPVSVFREILRNRDLGALVRDMDGMKAELDTIAEQTPQWRDSIGAELGKIIARDLERYKERAGRTFMQSLLDEYRSVDDLLQDFKVLEFEVVDARRKDYVYQMTTEIREDDSANKPVDFATDPTIIYWPFNGEFWVDELGYYRYTERGACNDKK